MTEPTPFLGLARVETMQRDFNRLRRAIRAHDTDASEAALDKCERWFSCISPNQTDAQQDSACNTSPML